MGRGLLLGMVVYAIYMALEPDVRRRWPETLIAWSRVLAGRLKDPLVGRDLLLGILVGVVHRLLDAAVAASAGVARPGSESIGAVSGLRRQPAETRSRPILNSSAVAVLIATTLLLIFFLLFLVVAAAGPGDGRVRRAVDLSPRSSRAAGRRRSRFVLAGIVVQTLTVTRLGLLALIVSLATSRLLDGTPLALDPGSWAFPATATLVGLLLAAAVYGFRTALAGRPLFDSRLLD